jgi:ferredoxin
MNKDIVIICESMYHGNTMKLATTMARSLNCRVMSGNEALLADLSKYKIIGLASGIYFTSHHPKIMQLANRLDSDQSAFIVSTHGGPLLGKYHAGIKQILIRRSVKILGEFSTKGYDCTGPFIIVGGGNKGRPNERDEYKAIKFTEKMLPSYTKDLTCTPHNCNVYVDAQCVGCGKCAAICPLNVFEIKDKKAEVINEKDCIHCSLCQKECQERAILIKHNFREAIEIGKRHAGKRSL